MAEIPSHRGPDPRDAEIFAPEHVPVLRVAVAELSWLLTRGYAEFSALKLVGDRHCLTSRQRMAVRRSACTDQALIRRARHRRAPAELAARTLVLDGFNVLMTVEAALAGAVVLVGRDGSYRDLAGVHGTYRRVEETRPALARIGATLAEVLVGSSHWLLDSPVSNSGRLAALIRAVGEENGWNWTVTVTFNPDRELATSLDPVATADAMILDRALAWFPLARVVIERHVSDARTIDLGVG